MSENKNAPKRIIPMNTPAKKVEANLVIEPSVPALLNDALSVISTEILRFKMKTSTGKPLDLAEARVLQGYIKSLTDLSREARERDDNTDLTNITDEELFKLIEQMKSRKES